MDHIFLHRVFVYAHHGCRWPGAGRIPRGAVPDDQEQVETLHFPAQVVAVVQRVALGEVVIRRALALEYRNRPRLGQGHQGVEAGSGAPGGVGHYDRIGGAADQFCHALYTGRVRMADGRRWAALQTFGRRPLFQHGLDGDIEKGRALGGALGQLPGASHRFVERLSGGDPAAPLGEWLHQTVGAADDAQVAEPLRAGVELGSLPVGGRLAGANQHRHFTLVCAVDAHGSLHYAYAGVQQHGLHPPGHAGVAGGHRHGQGLVPAVDVGRAGPLFQLLAGQRLPYRGPLGAGGRYDVVNVQVPQGFENGVPAVQPPSVPTFNHGARS